MTKEIDKDRTTEVVITEEQYDDLPERHRPKVDERPKAVITYRQGYIRPDNQWVPASVFYQSALSFSDVHDLLNKIPDKDKSGKTAVIVRVGKNDAIVYKYNDDDGAWERYHPEAKK